MMITNRKSNNILKQAGFSLLEMLLTISILSLVILMIFNVMQTYAERVQAKAAVDYFALIINAIDNVLDNTTYYDAIHAEAMTQTGGVLEYSLDEFSDGPIANGLDIPPSDILSSVVGSNDVNPLKTSTSIILHAEGVGLDRSLEVILMTNDMVSADKVRRAANLSNGFGGFLDDIGDEIKSAYSSWSFDHTLTDATTWKNDVLNNPLGMPSEDNGYYFAYYKYYGFEDISGDYLYRNRRTSSPELNRMYTDLHMGNNDILGADDVNLSGSAEVENAVTVLNSSAEIVGNTEINQGSAFVSRATLGGVTVRGVRNAGDPDYATMSVQGRIDNPNGNIELNDTLSAGSATINNGGLSVVGRTSIGSAEFTGEIQADDVNTNTIRSLTGNSDVTVTNSSVIQQMSNVGVLNVNGPAMGAVDITADDATIQGTLFTNTSTIERLDFGTFGECEKGC